MTWPIIGAGGGGSQEPRTPKEQKDNLNSEAFIRIVDVLGEGEIQGFATPEKAGLINTAANYNLELLKDIFLNNTPLLRATATTKAGTYTQNATTITVTSNAHGYSTGQRVYLSIATGLAASGIYKIDSATTNTFTALGQNDNTTSGNVGIALSSDLNFKNISITPRYGTATQGVIPGFNAIENEIQVGLVVEQEVPIVRTITNSNIDLVRLTVTVPQLQKIQDDGDIEGFFIDLNIQLAENGGTFTTVISDRIKGRTIDAYQRDYVISLANRTFPIDLKVVKVSADSDTSTKSNSFSWTSYTEIVDARLSYPHTALIGSEFSAEQFSSIPTRSFRIRGRKVKIPSNATVELQTGALLYSGVWNGSFAAAAWTSDPAWCLWDLLTDYRAGFGVQLNAANLDKWAFFTASKYCTAQDAYLLETSNTNKTGTYSQSGTTVTVTSTAHGISQGAVIYVDITSGNAVDGRFIVATASANSLTYTAATSATNSGNITFRSGGRTGTTNDYNRFTGKHGLPDGFGGFEPRFSCNVNIQTSEEAFKLINDLCSVFRAMPYWAIGALTVSQDAPQDPSFLFTLANVAEGGFSYTTSSSKTKPSVALVSYLDLNSRDIAYEQIEDADEIRRLGVVTQEVSAFACTSRGQARRIGEWLLYTNNLEAEIINFSCSIDAGVVVRPGQVISVADPVRAGARRGGRINAATTTTVTVDNATGLPSSGGTLSVILPDGVVQERNVTSRSGAVITVSTAFSVAPVANSVWIYENSSIEATTWRVITVQETDGIGYSISAVAYNPSKFDYIEREQALVSPDISDLNEPPESPTDLAITETLYTYQSEVRAKIIASWKGAERASSYFIRWRREDSNWTDATTTAPDYEILNITPGIFDFQISSVSAVGKVSNDFLEGSITALGKTAPPSNVTNFTFTTDTNIGVTLKWDAVSDLDVVGYEIRQGGSSWETATFLTEVTASSYKVGQLAPGTVVYRIKALDSSGVLSSTATSVTVAISTTGAPTVTGSIQGDTVVLSWNAVVGTYATDYYVIRSSAGSLGQSKTTSFSVPITWTGARQFFVKSLDIAGNESAEGTVTVTVNQAAAPTISYAYAGADVTLNWTEVQGSTTTRAYEIRYGASFATATVLAVIKSTSFTTPGSWTVNRTFYVASVDANGNLGSPGSVVVPISLPSIPSLLNIFRGEQVQLYWDPVSSSLDVAEYEIRRNDSGTTFNAAAVIGRIKGTTFNLKVDWVGSKKFWVVGIDVLGRAGTPDDVDVIVTAPSAPLISQQVIDNNVLLRWNDTTETLPVLYYELRRGSTWAGGTVIGTKQGLFTTVFETASGTYTYWLAGVDSAENYGTPGSVTATVNQPPDYILRSDINSDFSGTRTNVFVENGTLLVALNTTETWQDHFTTRSWSTPQDQINAGFTIYAMPSATTGSYVQEIDYGAVLAGTKISLTLTAENVAGSVTATPTIEYRKTTSGTGSTWNVFAGQSSVYATDFRYVRITYDFASSGGNDILRITQLNIRLDAKLVSDTGTGTANSADSGGTTVNFNVSFVDVQGIAVTPSGTTARLAIYDFVDEPNPTSFKVLLFDTSGNRVSGGFSWQARGT